MSARRSATGIYIVDGKLQIVELGSNKGGAELLGLAQFDLNGSYTPEGLESDESSVELEEAFSRAEAECDIRFENILICLDPQAYWIKWWPQLPEATGKLDRAQVQWETEQFLSDEISEYGVDFAFTSHCSIAVASRKRALEIYLDLCESAGLKDPDFDVAPLALFNAFESSDSIQDEPQLVLDISASGASALLLLEGDLVALDIWPWQSDAPGEAEPLEILSDRVEAMAKRSGHTELPANFWVAGLSGSDATWKSSLVERFAASVTLFDPFAGVERENCRCSDPTLLEGSHRFAVTAGLAHRGLSEP